MHSARGLYAIGDIHGHAAQLRNLMTRLDNDGMIPKRDTVIFLGDYVDRSPASADVVRSVQEWTETHPHWHALRGNHEQMMLDALRVGADDWPVFDRWWSQGGRETTASFAGKPLSEVVPNDARRVIPQHVLDWIAELPRLLVGERHAFVHGGVKPIPTWQTDTDPHDLIWIRDEFLDSDFDFGHLIVHGHTPVSAPVVRPNRIGIDTILRTGRLTAVELSEKQPRFIQSEVVK